MQSFLLILSFFTAGAAKDAGLPNITGDVGTPFRLFGTGTGAFRTYSANYHYFAEQSSAGAFSNLAIDASRINTIYGNSNTVQPTALTMKPLIKYI